jgi:hypothetical protein
MRLGRDPLVVFAAVDADLARGARNLNDRQTTAQKMESNRRTWKQRDCGTQILQVGPEP